MATKAPQGDESSTSWIFTVDVPEEIYGDHGVWVVVDRRTGAASAYTFD